MSLPDAAAAKNGSATSDKTASPQPIVDVRLNVGRAKAIKASHPVSANRPDQQIRILIVEDHQLLREGLRALLTLQPDLHVVGEAADGEEAVRLAAELEPDVMLLDFSMPNKSALDVVEVLAASQLRTYTIVVTAAIEKSDTVKLLQRGARGVLLKDSPSELLCKCIRKVHSGEAWIGRETVSDVLGALATRTDDVHVAPRRDFGLTPRERQIVGLIVQGQTNKGISHRLSIGEDTVKHHLTNAFGKTGTTSRLELALFAINQHLL